MKLQKSVQKQNNYTVGLRESMTSKERVQKVIHHKEPDRVPTGEWGIDHDHVTNIIGRHTFWRNRKDTTLALWDNRRDEVVESMKEDYSELVKTLDYDILTVDLVPSKHTYVKDKPKETGPGIWEDRQGNVYRYAPSNDSIVCVSQEEGQETLSAQQIEEAKARIENMDDSVFELIDYFTEKFGKEKTIICRSMDIYNIMLDVFGGDYSHHLMLTVTSPEEIKKLWDVCITYNKKIISHCAKKGVDIMMQGQDFGMNSGCIIRPETIRDIFMPVMKEVNSCVVDYGMVPFFHCCGKIWEILPDYVDVGYQGYQSIQESCGMDNRRLKNEYGDRLTLWTGVQCENLIMGNRKTIEEEVRNNLEILMPGGGFIFGSTNSVQYGAKTENYLRALEIVKTEGKYY
ncbi:MAG: uroporphyrinogen decarboxylase family protein [Oliverpabstia sp.]